MKYIGLGAVNFPDKTHTPEPSQAPGPAASFTPEKGKRSVPACPHCFDTNVALTTARVELAERETELRVAQSTVEHLKWQLEHAKRQSRDHWDLYHLSEQRLEDLSRELAEAHMALDRRAGP